MSRPIQQLTVREFQEILDAWTPTRTVDSVHMHCTDQPRHSNFRGIASVEAMRTFHRSIGMSDIAQHLTIDPRGVLWTGRPFEAMPASVRGHNGTPKKGPFMIEMVGLFQKAGGKVVDRFEGDQRQAVYAAVCALLRKFDLDETAVRFHREFPKTGKTCPGSDIDPDDFRNDLRKELAEEGLRSFDVALPRGAKRSAPDRETFLSTVSLDAATYLEVPEDAQALSEQAMLADWIDRGLVDPAAGNSRGAEPEYQELLPHLINTSQGVLSSEGRVWTTATDIRNLIDRHLTPAFDSGDFRHIVFYAHGGLNSEKGSLDYAKIMAPWWRSYGIFPIYFIWESSLFQTIFQAPRELDRPAGRGLGDFWDGIAETATKKLATKVWSRMKANARRCSEPTTDFGRPGGLFEFWTELEKWLSPRKEKIGIHAIGHSTGPILLSRFLPLVTGGTANLRIRTLSYLAPAIRIDDFFRDVAPQVGPGRAIERLDVYTMNDAAERDDTVAKVYRKSLLYYVRQACEGSQAAPILGLARDLYADGDARALFGLAEREGVLRSPEKMNAATRATIEFSQDEEALAQNPATAARQHGYFDNDPLTMNTVLARILGRSSHVGFSGGHPFPSKSEFERGEALDDVSTRSLEEVPESDASAACSCSCRCHDRSSSGTDEFDPDFDPDSVTPSELPDAAPEDAPLAPHLASGRRRALCVGIDEYPRNPLAGCVRDSDDWAEALAKEGFEVRKIQNKKATRAALDRALRDLVTAARAGDHLVFQFAGHGTQVEDLSGDEDDRFDEVVVPCDFDRGELWIDDDLYAIGALLPKGAALTMIMDCCHSGTNTRFSPALAESRGGAKARFLTLLARDVSEYKGKWKGTRGAAPVREREPQPGIIHLAACRDSEVAYEENGRGNFSRHALAVLGRSSAQRQSNRAFIDAVVKQFGSDQRQHPLLDKVAGSLDKAIFLGRR